MPRSRNVAVLAALLALFGTLPARAGDGAKVTCEILENATAASGTVVVSKDGAEVARGVCGKSLSLPAGQYQAVLALDGALDGPEQQQSLNVEAGKPASLRADFATGLLEVRIQSEGRETAGMAVIRKADRQIGTLGSGVAAHLSVGTYEVVARYRAQQQAFKDVQITQGKSTVLEAKF